jgi:transposase
MELAPIYKRVIGLDVHQAKISACAVAEPADGAVTVDARNLAASSAIGQAWLNGRTRAI